MIYIAEPGIALPRNTSALGIHTDKASEVRFVTKKTAPKFKSGDVLYVTCQDGTVTKHTFYKPFNKKEQDTYNEQSQTRDRERQFATLRTRVNGAFNVRISKRLSEPALPWKIVTFGDLVRRSEEDLRSIGLGKVSMRDLRDTLASMGLMLGMLRYMKIDELGLSLRTTNALTANNVTNVEVLLKQTRTQVRSAVQSEKATKEIEEKLATMGFTFAE